MTNTLHFSEWINCTRAQRKVNLCAPGAPKGPKVGMFVRQYDILCANDAGRAPRKYPVWCVTRGREGGRGEEGREGVVGRGGREGGEG